MGFEKNRHSGALIFDLDGTLADTSGDIVHTVNHIRKLVGLSELDTESVLKVVGRGSARLLAEITGIGENDLQRKEEVSAEFKRHYLEHQTERSKLYPGIRDSLVDLSKRYDLFVLSNKPHIAVERELDGHGISSFFLRAWGGGSLPALKPDPVGVERVIELGGYTSRQVLMIGDMTIDLETARNAGVKSCYVSWGFGALGNGAPTPELKVDRVEDLAAAIDELLSPAR